ncbi:MAG: hypothetical protein AABY22_22980 [Nanoarchaeota archaeon]
MTNEKSFEEKIIKLKIDIDPYGEFRLEPLAVMDDTQQFKVTFKFWDLVLTYKGKPLWMISVKVLYDFNKKDFIYLEDEDK